jgi:hypothetical protein
VHLDTDNDLFLLQSLVSLAIQANDPARRPHRHTVAACPHAGPGIWQRRRRTEPDLVAHGLARHDHPAGRR